MRPIQLINVVCIVVLTVSAAFARHIDDTTHGFSVDIPDTFKDTSFPSKRPEWLHAFKQDKPRTFIFIAEIPGTIGQDNGAFAVEIARRKGKSFVVPWKTFELIGFEAPANEVGANASNLAVQVPLVPRAIQVTVLGLPQEEARLKTVLIQVVGTIQGKTNWLPWGLSWLRPLGIALCFAFLVAAFMVGRRKKAH